MQNIENSCAMLEEDKVIKDRQNRRQEREEIQIAEDRCIHLAKVKVKLGQSLDEAEDALTLERERKSKGIVEKIKRKLEAEVDAGGLHLPGAYQSQPVPDQHAQGEVRSRCPPWLPSSRTRSRWACSTGPR